MSIHTLKDDNDGREEPSLLRIGGIPGLFHAISRGISEIQQKLRKLLPEEPPLQEDVGKYKKEAKELLASLYDQSVKTRHHHDDIILGRANILEGLYSEYQDLFASLEKHYNGDHDGDSKVWEAFIAHLHKLERKKGDQIFALGRNFKDVYFDFKKSRAVMGAVATNLDSPGVEEALKVLPLLDSIIDKNDPDIKGETIGANAVFATVEILAERKKGNIGVVDAIKKHKGPMTVEAFREIAEKLNGT